MTIGSVRQHRPDDTNPRNLAVSVRRALDGLNAGATPVGGVPVTKFGMRPDARKDQLAAFQSAIDSGEPLMVPAGSYILDGQVRLVSGLRLMAHGATFLFQDQGWPSAGWANSFVRQADQETALSDVVIDGGTWQVDGADTYGDLFAVNIDNFTLRNARFQWSYGRAFLFVGDNALVQGCTFLNDVPEEGTGAFRVYGGRGGRVIGCWGRAGDDLWQVVPGPGINADLDIEDWAFIGCAGETVPGGGTGGGLIAQIGSPGKYNADNVTVRNIRWIGCTHRTGQNAGARFIFAEGSTGRMEDISLVDCTIDCSLQDDTTFQNNGVRIYGPIRSVALISTSIKAPRDNAVRAVPNGDGDGPGLVQISGGGLYEASRKAASNTLRLTACEECRIIGGVIVQGRPDANLVHVGAPGADVARFEASGNTFRDIGDTVGSTRRYAVNLEAGGMARLSGNTFTEASGATNSTGIRMASTWGNCEAFEDNDFTGIDRDFLPVAPAAIAQPRKTIGNFASPNAGGVVSGSYYDNSAHAQATTTRALSANHFFLAPFFSSVDLPVDRLGLSLTVAGGAGTNGRIVVYSTGPDGWPDALLYESADFLIDAATLCEDTAADFTFKAGAMYWIGGRVESACTARALQNYQSSNLGLSSGSSNTYFTVLLRTLAYATATPATYGFTAANRTANWAVPSIRMRAA